MRVHRLVAFAIRRSIFTRDVGRQRYVPKALDRCADAAGIVGPQTDRPPPIEVTREDLAVQRRTIALEDDARSRSQLLTRMHQRFPIPCWKTAKQQTLDGTPGWYAAAEQSRGKHACVVDDEQIARLQVLDEMRERRVLEANLVTMKDEEPRLASLFGRVLCDQIIGQSEIEVADVHAFAVRPFAAGFEKNVMRSVRPLVASNPFQRSPRLASRARTLSMRKSSIVMPLSTSAHVSGVDTVASGRGLTE